MTEVLLGVILGVLLCGVLGAGALLLWRRMRSPGPGGREVRVVTSIDELRSLGILSVFKVVTKEIVTARDHWAGAFGKKYLGWLMSAKKMAMIFEFDIDFRYDLHDPNFEILPQGAGRFTIQMPRCTYEIHIRDINFYDEQKARLLPWLLPDLVTAVFGTGFNEEDRNRLKEEAKEQAFSLAQNLVGKLRSEVQTSARQTMEALSKGFGAESVQVVFKDWQPEKVGVAYAVNAEAA